MTISPSGFLIGECPFPIRINERVITFQVLDRTITLDPDFDEPVGEDVLGDTFIVAGQVNFRGGPHKKRETTFSGDQENVKGHLVFRMCDLIDVGLATLTGTTISFVLKTGDRVIRIGKRPENFEVTEVRPESPLRGDFLLVYVKLKHGAEERSGVPRR